MIVYDSACKSFLLLMPATIQNRENDYLCILKTALLSFPCGGSIFTLVGMTNINNKDLLMLQAQ